MKDKLKKILALGLIAFFAFTTVSNTSAYYTQNSEKNSYSKLENVDIKNVFPYVDKIGSFGSYNGTTTSSNGIVTMTWTGKSNPSHPVIYAEGHPYYVNSTASNKLWIDELGMTIESGKTYKISYDITGSTDFDYSVFYLFFSRSNYECPSDYPRVEAQGNHVSYIFKTPLDAKYLNIRIDPYFNNPVSGKSYAKISNIKVQKVLN